MTNETLTLSQLAALTSQRELTLRVLSPSAYLRCLAEPTPRLQALPDADAR